MRFPYLNLMHEESRDLATYLGGRSDKEWNAPSLCTGWRVREVVSHMAAGHTASLGAYLSLLVRNGFSVDRTSDALARSFAGGHTNARSWPPSPAARPASRQARPRWCPRRSCSPTT